MQSPFSTVKTVGLSGLACVQVTALLYALLGAEIEHGIAALTLATALSAIVLTREGLRLRRSAEELIQKGDPEAMQEVRARARRLARRGVEPEKAVPRAARQVVWKAWMDAVRSDSGQHRAERAKDRFQRGEERAQEAGRILDAMLNPAPHISKIEDQQENPQRQEGTT